MSRQDTLLASDPIWTKSPFVSGLPTLIPYRNEPPMSFHILPEGINSLTPRSAPRSLESLPQTLQLAEVDKVDIDVQISVTPESGHQVGIFCTFNLHIPTYVLRARCSRLDCPVRIPFLLVTLFG